MLAKTFDDVLLIIIIIIFV